MTRIAFRLAPIVTVLAVAVSTAACATESGQNPTAGTGDGTTPSVSASATAPSGAAGSVSADSSFPASSGASASPNAQPSATIPAGPIDAPDTAAQLMAALQEADPAKYTQNGGSALAGTHFSTPDRNLTCMFNADIQQCYYLSARRPVFGADYQCPTQRGKVDPLRSDLIGWGTGLTPLDTEPVTCRLTGVFPYMFGESEPLPPGRKLTVQVRPDTVVTCGNRRDIIVCASGPHGFAASAREFVRW